MALSRFKTASRDNFVSPVQKTARGVLKRCGCNGLEVAMAKKTSPKEVQPADENSAASLQDDSINDATLLVCLSDGDTRGGGRRRTSPERTWAPRRCRSRAAGSTTWAGRRQGRHGRGLRGARHQLRPHRGDEGPADRRRSTATRTSGGSSRRRRSPPSSSTRTSSRSTSSARTPAATCSTA